MNKLLEMLEQVLGLDEPKAVNQGFRDASYRMPAILDIIMNERIQQNKKFGGFGHDLKYSPAEWVDIVRPYLLKAKQTEDVKERIDNVGKATAVLVAWLQTESYRINSKVEVEISVEQAKSDLMEVLSILVAQPNHPMHKHLDCVKGVFKSGSKDQDYIDMWRHFTDEMSIHDIVKWEPKTAVNEEYKALRTLLNYRVSNPDSLAVREAIELVQLRVSSAILQVGDLRERFRNLYLRPEQEPLSSNDLAAMRKVVFFINSKMLLSLATSEHMDLVTMFFNNDLTAEGLLSQLEADNADKVSDN